MGWTINAEAGCWIVLALMSKLIPNIHPLHFFWLSLVLSSILFMASLFVYEDSTHGTGQIGVYTSKFRNVGRGFWRALVAITVIAGLAEFAYFIFLYDEQKSIFKSLVPDALLSGSITMFFGSWVQGKFHHISEKFFIIIGITVSLVGLLIHSPIFFNWIQDPAWCNYLANVSYGIIGLGSGFFLPCFYSLASKGRSLHHQGMLTGWIDSIRTAGDCVTTADIEQFQKSFFRFIRISPIPTTC